MPDRNGDSRCRFDLSPELLDVVTPLIPAPHHICLVRIKTTSMPMVVVRFHILCLCEPAASSFVSPSPLAWRSLWSSFRAFAVLPPVDSVHTVRLGVPSKIVHQRSPESRQVLL